MTQKSICSILVILLTACATVTPPGPAVSPVERTPTVSERIRRVETGLAPPVRIKGAPEVRLDLRDRMRLYHTAGVSVAVINNGEIEWARGWGVREAGNPDLVDSATLFAAGSISKPVAAMAALRLVEAGKLSLNANVNEQLRSWKVPENEFTRHEKVSLRRLLNHTSGLGLFAGDGRPPALPLPSIAQALSGEKNNQPAVVAFTPGARQQYSSAGFSVVQLLVSDQSGKSFDDAMRETVFAPLGMTRSTYQEILPDVWKGNAARGHNSMTGEPGHPDLPASVALAAAGLWTTPTDLARFVVALQKARAGASGYVLAQESADFMLTPSRGIWSLGLQVDTKGRTPRFWHDGSVPGFLSYMVAYNWTGQGAVVMVNQDAYNGLKIAAEIMYGIAREYGWPDFGPIERIVGPAQQEKFPDYVGLYEIDQGYPVTIVERAGKLFLIWALGGTYEMHPVTDDEFFIARDGAPTFRFLRNPSGHVTGVARGWYGGESTGARSALPAPGLAGTVFRLRGYEDALVVSLAGDFNQWKHQATTCTREAGGWICRAPLPPGRHRYVFLVDNERVPDPSNPLRERDQDFHRVSIIEIP